MGTDPTDFNSTLSAGSASASAISTLAGNDGSGAINGGSVTAFTGTATQINTALGDMGADPTDFDSTLSSGSASASAITTLRMMGQVR